MDKILSAEEALAQKGMYATTVVGVSMLPLLTERRDTVTVTPLEAPPKKYDVVLFRREGQLVLHRIVGQREGCFLIRGDNCVGCDQVEPQQILGVMTAFTRGSKQHSAKALPYRLYSRLWVASFPIRRLWARIKRRLHG